MLYETCANCPSLLCKESRIVNLKSFSLLSPQSDLYGQSLLNITHPDDHAFLKQQLVPTDLHNLFAAKTDENGEIRSRTEEEEEEIDRKLREDRRDFNIRQEFLSELKR